MNKCSIPIFSHLRDFCLGVVGAFRASFAHRHRKRGEDEGEMPSGEDEGAETCFWVSYRNEIRGFFGRWRLLDSDRGVGNDE